jgi:hypothetical protein
MPRVKQTKPVVQAETVNVVEPVVVAKKATKPKKTEPVVVEVAPVVEAATDVSKDAVVECEVSFLEESKIF